MVVHVVERGAGGWVDADVRVGDEAQDLRVRGSTQEPNPVKQAPRREIRTDCLELAAPAGNSQPSPVNPWLTTRRSRISGSWSTPSCGSSRPTYTSLGSTSLPRRIVPGPADSVDCRGPLRTRTSRAARPRAAAARVLHMSAVGHQDDVCVANHHRVGEVGDPPERAASEALLEQAREQVVLVEHEPPVEKACGERQWEQSVRRVVRVEKGRITQQRAHPTDEELCVRDDVFSEQPRLSAPTRHGQPIALDSHPVHLLLPRLARASGGDDPHVVAGLDETVRFIADPNVVRVGVVLEHHRHARPARLLRLVLCGDGRGHAYAHHYEREPPAKLRWPMNAERFVLLPGPSVYRWTA